MCVRKHYPSSFFFSSLKKNFWTWWIVWKILFIRYGRNFWKFDLFEIVYLHCLSIRRKKKKTTFIFFFFFLLGIIVTSNRIHIMKKKPISLFLLFFLTRCVFFLSSFTNSRRFLTKYPLFFSSLCLIKLCVNCVRFHRTFLSV